MPVFFVGEHEFRAIVGKLRRLSRSFLCSASSFSVCVRRVATFLITSTSYTNSSNAACCNNGASNHCLMCPANWGKLQACGNVPCNSTKLSMPAILRQWGREPEGGFRRPFLALSAGNVSSQAWGEWWWLGFSWCESSLIRDNSGGTWPAGTLHVVAVVNVVTVVAAAAAMVTGGNTVLDVGCCTDATLSTAEDSGTVTVPPVWIGSNGKAACDVRVCLCSGLCRFSPFHSLSVSSESSNCDFHCDASVKPPPPRVTCCRAETLSSSITANCVIDVSRLFSLQLIGLRAASPDEWKRRTRCSFTRSFNGSRCSVTGDDPIKPALAASYE